jgi:hypothetical protein
MSLRVIYFIVITVDQVVINIHCFQYIYLHRGSMIIFD